MPHVFELLKEDHRLVESLFQQFEQSQDPAVAVQICDELTIHALLEEELVYGLLGAKISTADAQEAREEHQQAKDLVSQIERGLQAGEDVLPVVLQLKETMQHHVQEEEGTLFPKMEAAIPQQLSHMGDEIVDRKQQLQQQMADARSVGSPSTVVGNKPVTS